MSLFEQLLTLEAGSMRARVSPHQGGSVVDWVCGDTPIFRPLADGALDARNARFLASFPLLPYSNRIADGRFTWHDQSYQLDHNFLPEHNTIHGVGWQQPWTVADSTPTQVRLTLQYNPDEAGLYTWPFRFRAEQVIALDDAGLDITLTLHNTGSYAWPAGLGLHPHFPRGSELQLGFHADAVWTTENNLPVAPEPPPSDWQFDPPKPVSGPPLDHCFSGWDGTARIMQPTHTVTLQADPIFGYLVVYAPEGRDFVAVEPASHLPDAINRPGEHGLRVLEPGGTLTGHVRFSVTAA